MLGSSKLVAFIGTTDSDKARHFYGSVLGLSFVSEDPFALVFDANSVMVRISKLDAVTPAPYTVLGWEVADIKGMVQSLHSEGIEFERFPGLEQGETGVWVSPSGAKVAWFKDPDGNVLSLGESA